MKTVLIPVDFTATSDNAVSYAAEWCKMYGYKRIILLKTLYDSMLNSLIPAAQYANESREYLEHEREEATEKLQAMYMDKILLADPHIKVQIIVSEIPLLRCLLEVVGKEQPDLIIVGSDSYSYSSDSFIAGNVIGIARISPVRVLIVPAEYHYQPVKQVLVPCDFNTVGFLTKIEQYQAATPLWKNKKLMVLYVDPKERYRYKNEQFRNAEKALHQYLQNFQYEVHFSNNKNIIEGILDFSKKNDVQLIVALPGKHSFLFMLTHKSISEAIYRNAQEPVLILK